MLMDRRMMLILPAALCCRAAYCQTPWTTIKPTDGVWYVSSSAGSDANPGTQAAPFRSLSRGYQALRDGHADQLLLKAGDTWAESFPSTWAKGSGQAAYMVVGAYGLVPGVDRPKLRVSSPVVYGGNAGRSGLALMDLDVAPSSPGSGYAAFTFFQPWGHILIEGCSIAGFPVNIVCQETGAGRLDDIRIRNCVIVDSLETGTGHSQGVFMGSCDHWVIEGCVLDLNASTKHDLFCHNVYLHETNGPGIFRYNISARACSHGVQQRPGGTMVGNLFLANPNNALLGGGGPQVCTDNVCLDSGDINSVDKRGHGYDLYGDGTFARNVAAHNVLGSWPVAFSLSISGSFTDNVVYAWSAPGGEGWASAYQWDGGGGSVTFTRNSGQMFNHGVLSRHEARGTAGITYSLNHWWTNNPFGGYGAFQAAAGSALTWTQWQAAVGDAGSTFAQIPGLDASISKYMTTIGRSGGLPEFMAEARLFARNNDRHEFTASGVNPWVRSIFGLGPPPCYADMNGDGTLNVLDFVAFENAFAAGDLRANCDGSTVDPVLNALDFQCFLNRYAAGCP